MSDDTADDGREHSPDPNPALARLDALVGTWTVEGREFDAGAEMTGDVSFEWLDGGFFLVRDIDLRHDERPVTGIEIIGYDASSGTCTSHCFEAAAAEKIRNRVQTMAFQ